MNSMLSQLGLGTLNAERLERANIHPQTGLATDYLNHFNEVVMLLEMLPDLPDCVEDVLEWQPRNYVEHFENSSFSEKSLAINAYHASPAELREALQTAVTKVDRKVADLQGLLTKENMPLEERLRRVAHETVGTVRPLINKVGSIIHGHILGLGEQDNTKATQEAVDALFV
ncbi:hypothetical protein [Flexibacterium corallicola]|uniref:hypothetical protein n=1 Tax=Flexibacterium corallicola TaxID=3037259 RepID=UPI00286EBA33|nr:hypothetical protein [Pseudovibrio sp. M1P-2-3]